MSLFGDGIDLLKLVDKGHNAPLYSELGRWIDKVADLQKKNEELAEELASLREALRFKGSLERITGHIFVEGDEEEVCPRCAEVDSKMVHLLMLENAKPPFFRSTCPECKTTMRDTRPRTRLQLASQLAKESEEVMR